MNYVVPLCTLTNFKLVGVGTNCFYKLVRCKLFACQGLIIPILYLEVSSINQNPIIDVEVSGFLNMKGPSFMVDSFADILDVVVYYIHFIEPFFYNAVGEVIVVIMVYGVWIEGIKTSVEAECVASGSCIIIVEFRKS